MPAAVTKLDYEPKRLPDPGDAGMTLCYLLLLAPVPLLVLAGTGSLGHRATRQILVVFCVCLGFAMGAAIHILRRRRRDGAAWVALVIWGGFSLLLIVGALAN